jgi:hypothetical protein
MPPRPHFAQEQNIGPSPSLDFGARFWDFRHGVNTSPVLGGVQLRHFLLQQYKNVVQR